MGGRATVWNLWSVVMLTACQTNCILIFAERNEGRRMPIETLTSHQERMLERWSTAWLHSARDTTPADRRRAEQAIGGLCRAARRFPSAVSYTHLRAHETP